MKFSNAIIWSVCILALSAINDLEFYPPLVLSLPPSSKSTQFTVSLSYPISITHGHNKDPEILKLLPLAASNSVQCVAHQRIHHGWVVCICLY